MSNWTSDILTVLESLRVNSVILAQYHKKQYLKSKSTLKYFKVPIIIISSFNSVFNFVLLPYMPQETVSSICCGLSLVTGLITSLELYLQIEKRMERELTAANEFYLIAIDIYKVLNIDAENRNGDGVAYLEEQFNAYVKLIESSEIVEKKITDKLTTIEDKDFNVVSSLSSLPKDSSKESFNIIL
jgi:hypothetical protein